MRPEKTARVMLCCGDAEGDWGIDSRRIDR